MLTAQHVRDLVKCVECTKPRCIYSKQQLTDREKREVRRIMRSYDFHCGCMVTPNISFLSGVIFTRLELNCSSPIEWAYYGSSVRNAQKNLCSHCGKNSGSVDPELKKYYRTVLPICDGCKVSKDPMKRMPYKTAAAQRSIKNMFPQKRKR